MNRINDKKYKKKLEEAGSIINTGPLTKRELLHLIVNKLWSGGNLF